MKFLCQICIVLMVTFLSALPAVAGEILLGMSGKTNYQLVAPPSHPDKVVDASLQKATELMVKAFAAQGISITVVQESDVKSNAPAIYLGQTKYATEHGVTFETTSGWTYTWKVVGKNIIIAGNDHEDLMPMEKRRPREVREGGIQSTGTLKGVCEFMYRYMGARFLAPGDDHLMFEASPIIFVPDDLNTTRRPFAQNMEITRSKDPYFVANGMEANPLVLSNYGHFHHVAITEELYAKTHPEYFMWGGGKRQTNSGHYCLSNPEVREVIYQKILEYCDTGYKIIEMGQNDGWRPCGCEDCYNLYNIRPTHVPGEGIAYLMDAAWGEKLWIMHRDMALRLMKDRPDAKMSISAYSVARRPPTTISSFPPNVMIEIMAPTRELMEAWNKIEIPGGYAAYLYTWGASRYTPVRSAAEMKELVSVLVENNIRLIQINGKPISYGLEGINIYAFGRMMNDPTAKPIEDYYDEYIRAAYKESAGPMQSFYRKLNQRMMFMPETVQYSAVMMRNPLLLFSTIYTPDLMVALEAQLAMAQKRAQSQDVKDNLATIRLEFDYLKHITTVIAFYYAYQTEPKPVFYNRLLDALESRNQWLGSLQGKKPGSVDPSQPSWAFRSIDALKYHGRTLNIEPFNWDIQARREMKPGNEDDDIPELLVSSAKGKVAMDAPFWKDLPVYKLNKVASKVKGELEQSSSFQLAYDNDNLYIRVVAGVNGKDMVYHPRGRDAEIWLQECINFQITPTGDKSQYFYFNYEPVANSYTDAEHGFITDVLHPQYGWNDNTWDGEWSYVNVLDKANNQWVSMVSIPFKTLRAQTPTSGSLWMFNLARIHYKNQKEEPDNFKNREYASWTGKINASKILGDAQMGPLVFE